MYTTKLIKLLVSYLHMCLLVGCFIDQVDWEFIGVISGYITMIHNGSIICTCIIINLLDLFIRTISILDTVKTICLINYLNAKSNFEFLVSWKTMKEDNYHYYWKFCAWQGGGGSFIWLEHPGYRSKNLMCFFRSDKLHFLVITNN